MDEATWHRLRPYFDPIEPATEELYVERTDSAWEALWRSRQSEDPKAALLVGPQATGKSSELLHLARRLSTEKDAPLVCLLPLWRQYDTTELDAAKVLFLVGIAILRLGSKTDQPPKTLKTELEKAYTDAVQLERGGPKLDMNKLLGGLALLASKAVDSGATAIFTLFGTASKALSGVGMLSLPGESKKLKANDPRALRMAELVKECVIWSRSQLGGARIAMFVDGLDKLGTNDRDPYFGSTVLAQPRSSGFQVIYAAPLSTYRGIEETELGDQFDFLPVGNFRVFADRAPHDPRGPGFERMREIVARRLLAAGVKPDAAIEGGLESDAVKDAIVASGGIPRFLIRILKSAFLNAVRSDPKTNAATAEDIGNAIHREETNIVRRISESDMPDVLPILREVLQSCNAPRTHARMLIRKNIVLVYENHYDWYRPSPLLDEFLGDSWRGA